MEKIEEWIATNYGSVYGSGDGDGDGDGYGSGNGSGDGSVYGSGDGSGDGDGYGSGNGSGYGSVYGSGDGSGIKMYNHQKIYRIDGVNTVITSIKGNVAKGFILNRDLTTSKCFVVKGNGYFAHGETLREANQSLQEKILENMDIEEKIDRVLEEYEKGVKYPNKMFFELHHILTGSCLMGRNQFVKDHGIDIESEMTVDEFVELTEHDYGSDAIQMLKERWNERYGIC